MSHYIHSQQQILFWQCDNKAQAERFLLDWCTRAESTDNPHLKRFAQTIAGQRTWLLAWYEKLISTGPLEGANNKIKIMKRQAYSYRDIEFFKLKIKAPQVTKYALVGWTFKNRRFCRKYRNMLWPRMGMR